MAVTGPQLKAKLLPSSTFTTSAALLPDCSAFFVVLTIKLPKQLPVVESLRLSYVCFMWTSTLGPLKTKYDVVQNSANPTFNGNFTLPSQMSLVQRSTLTSTVCTRGTERMGVPQQAKSCLDLCLHVLLVKLGNLFTVFTRGHSAYLAYKPAGRALH